MKNAMLYLCLCIMSTLSADDQIQLKDRHITSTPKNFIISDKNSDKLIQVSTQFLLPAKDGKGSRNSFIFNTPKHLKENGNYILKGNGAFTKQHSNNINLNVTVDYAVHITPDGKLLLNYSYENKGDTFFFKPFVNVSMDYDKIKGKEWFLKSNSTLFKSGKWPEEIRNALISTKSQGRRFKEAHLTQGIFKLADNRELKFLLPNSMQLRLIGAGTCQIYNLAYSSYANKPESEFTKYNDGWKAFPTAQKINIHFEILLPGATANTTLSSPANIAEASNNDEKTLSHVEIMRKKSYPLPSSRPVIKNGTFYYNEKPLYMLGPWLDLLYEDSNSKIPLPEYQEDRAYNNYFDYDIATKKGFNTCHPMMLFWFTCKRHFPKSEYLKNKLFKRGADYFDSFIRNLKDMPLVVDFASIGLGSHAVVKETPAELKQQNPNWHQFVPFCPEHPDGKKIYLDFWTENTKRLLKLGANPWIYELFNEPAYDCRCSYNKKAFIEFLKTKYGSLESCNQTWGSSFKSFAEIISSDVFERQKGLQVDWYKFIENRWCDILREGKNAIKAIDKRDHIYFSSQRAIAKSFFTSCMGYDEYKIARTMDMVNTEGGVSFYKGKSIDNDDPMEAHQKGAMRMILDCARAAAAGKPVIDTEQSTKRFDENGKRIPSKRSDLNLMLWNQAVHGSSLTMLYCWIKSQWLWPTKDFTGAKNFIHQPRRAWAQGGLLNPYSYPKSTLDGIKDFKEEMEKLADIIMPLPRIKGRVALLLSNPTRRATSGITDQFTNYYDALSSTHIPFDIIFEEQLATHSKNYQAIISPVSTFTYPQTATLLQNYVKQGGTFIAQGMDLSMTEYSIPVNNNSLFGLKQRQHLEMPLPFSAIVENTEISGSIEVSAEAASAEPILVSRKKHPLIFMNKIDKGKVFYLSFKAKSKYLTTVMQKLFSRAGIHTNFALKRFHNASPLPAVEVQLIDRGDTKLFYFVNWQPLTELGRFTIKLPDANYILTDPVDDKIILNSDGQKKWTAKQLENGMPILLKAEEKALLLITKEIPEFAHTGKTLAQIEKNYQEIRVCDEALLTASLHRMQELKQQKAARNSFLQANQKKCFSIDISKHCNMGFKDDISGDKKGGAFDQGANDLREFPTGHQNFCNIPFSVINPDKNSGLSMLVLQGTHRDYFPAAINDIPVDEKSRYLYFLHTMGWEHGHFSYFINYADGTNIEIPIRSGKEIGGWWHPAEDKAPNAKLAWIGKNSACKKIGAYCFRWQNPHPEKIIKSINIKSNNMEMVPAVIAITGERP